MDTSFRYRSSPARIHVGERSLSRFPKVVERADAERPFVVCGRTVAHDTELLSRIGRELETDFAGVFDGVRPESPLASVQAGVRAASDGDADLLVAVGGGSAVVTARAMTVLLAEDGSPHDLCTQYPPDGDPYSPRLEEPKLPNVVVPTTPTTATNRAGAAVRDDEEPRRLEFFDPKTRPAAIFVAPDALRTAPAALYRKTATTTFCGLVDSLQSPRLNALGFADLRQALELTRTHLPAVSDRPDPEVRVQLAVAALLANRASQARSYDGGTGSVASGLVHQLQVLYDDVHQGPASAAVAVPSMRFNRDVLREEQARLADVWGVGREATSEAEKANAAAEAVETFLETVGMPLRLRELDVPRDDLDRIARHAMDDYFLRTNPREVEDADQLTRLLHDAW
ncbi:MAG: iron-containing alcohol dehydrogenase family protein [Haloglomus sp.]